MTENKVAAKSAPKSPVKTVKPAAKAAPKTTPKAVAKPAPKSTVKPLAKSAPASPAAVTKKPVKVAKAKVVRDTFNMPQEDYARIATLKKSCLAAGTRAKKSELLRAGLQLLGKLSATELKKAIALVQAAKP